MPRRRLAGWLAGLAVALLSTLLGACSSLPDLPRLPPAPRSTGELTVVFVPGITGTKLRHRETGRIAWGTGAGLLRPWDGGYGLALSIAAAGQPEPGLLPTLLEPDGLLEEIRLTPMVRKKVYGPIFELLEEAGYRRGETFFPFAYDWRQDNVANARRLAEFLEALPRPGGERLPVALVCQSNGAHLCRYLTKYGGAPLEEAEAGRAGPPPGIDVKKVILIGTANGGSLRILKMLLRGRRYLPAGRWWSPEALFTFPAVYQELPVYRDRFLLDAAGRPLPDDLHDPATWRRYGWSIYEEATGERLARGGDEFFADAATREAYLAGMLERARRFHEVLHRDAPGFDGNGKAPAYHLIQNVYTETPDRALVLPTPEGWQTLFTGDPPLAKDSLRRFLTGAPGDEHATHASQLWLSPQELAALASEPLLVKGGHFELILAPAARRRLLEVLASP